MLAFGVTLEKAPDEDVELSISFGKGVPMALSEKNEISQLLAKLNELGGRI